MTAITRQRRWRNENPARYRAHLDVQSALRRGLIQKQPCEVCGAAKVDAHHDRYDSLAVRWLCRRHHARLHSRERRA
ncbi:hypothetical protein [Frigidibacter oleivorans]|uniref:hypothetical protein n=1 Tax=Frigidibacter oleivorans TaxID=2487129 RepID=UPI000F8C64C9|nr:hypothetical protein [Frigidibacter oleivorans]